MSNALLFAGENLRAIGLMVAGRAVFAASDTFTKLAGEGGLPASEIVVLRNTIALPILIAIAWRLGALRHWRAIRDPAVLWRSVLEGIGLFAFVTALPHVQIGQSTVILLTVPIILVALSAIFFKEQVGWRRWTAIIVGFIGVFMVAGPGGGASNIYVLITLVTAFAWAVRDLITSRIAGHIPSIMVALTAVSISALVALPGAAAGDWRALSGDQTLYLLASGCLVAFANLLYISALRRGAISVVAPFRYTGAVWATLAGFMVWGDVPDIWGVVGTLLIIGSGLYTFYRELELARAGRRARA